MTESEVPPMLKWKENFHLGPQMLHENCQKSTKHPKKLKHDVYNCLFGVELRSTVRSCKMFKYVLVRSLSQIITLVKSSSAKVLLLI